MDIRKITYTAIYNGKYFNMRIILDLTITEEINIEMTDISGFSEYTMQQ